MVTAWCNLIIIIYLELHNLKLFGLKLNLNKKWKIKLNVFKMAFKMLILNIIKHVNYFNIVNLMEKNDD